MNLLTREQIIAAQDRRYVDVHVPEWGGTVRLQSLDADQTLRQEALNKKRQEGDSRINPLTMLAAESIVDADGKRIFSDKDMEVLGRKSPPALLRIIKAIKELNVDGVEVPDMGNSQASQSADSPSSSV